MQYITYIYRHPISKEIFYVGAGSLKQERHLRHLYIAESYVAGTNSAKRENKTKLGAIVDILEQGLTPQIDIIFTGSRVDAFMIEEEVIARLGRIDLGTGSLTNLREGGLKGRRQRNWSQEARDRKRVATLGKRNSFYGKSHSEKARKKISEAAKNRSRPHTTETKAKIARFGADNHASKKWIAVSPSGEREEFVSIREWCRSKNFPMDTAYGISRTAKPAASGRMKGWAILRPS